MTLNETIDKYKMFVENCQKRINHSSKMGYKDKEIYTEWKDEYQQMVDWLEELKEYKDSQPCEDCISRQALIEKATSWDKHFADSERCVSLTDIQNAPSVTPQPKIGKWIEKTGEEFDAWAECSECGCVNPFEDDFNYCPNCGARMEG